jgi:hypothetical protein
MNFLTVVTSSFLRRKAAQTPAASIYTFAKNALARFMIAVSRVSPVGRGSSLRKSPLPGILSDDRVNALGAIPQGSIPDPG